MVIVIEIAKIPTVVTVSSGAQCDNSCEDISSSS